MAKPRTDLHGVLVVDKAAGVTSHDVVGMARRALQTREIGHTGTLDPMATGVLVLAIGEGTKLVNQLTALAKSYEATLRLGQATDSLDADGQVVAEAAVPLLERAAVEAALARFVGVSDQRAPVISAIKVNGRALYELARKGREVEAPLRRVTLHEAELLGIEGRELRFRVRCGKGFYVRSLGRDLAEALGTLGHLSALRRTENGSFSLAEAVPQALLRSAAVDTAALEAVRARVIPLDQLARALRHVVLTPEGVQHARHGRAIPRACVLRAEPTLPEPEPTMDAGSSEHEPPADSTERPETIWMALDEQGAVMALVAPSGDALRVVRGIRRD